MAEDTVTRLQGVIKDALKAGDKPRVEVLRLLLSAVKQQQIDSKRQIDEGGLFYIIDKMIKQRRESIRHYEAGGRADLAEKEEAEIRLLEEYQPAAATDAEVDAAVAAAIAQTGAGSIKEMGKVMSAVDKALGKPADKSKIAAKVKDKLS